MSSPSTIRSIRKSLLKWYHREKRDLPWRNTNDPYRIWVSEVMLQQTQVQTVIPYYRRWIGSFPTIKELAEADEAIVLKHWEGLGYYSRARNLKKAAQKVQQEFDGKLPQTLSEILKLPGIGRYTAGAVLSIAFNKRLPVLDGNVKRALSRLFRLRENGSTSKSENRLWKTAETLVPEGQAGDFNQAIMELGATVCLPQNPACVQCPLKNNCQANLEGVQSLYPPAQPKIPSKKIQVSAAVIQRNGKVYIQQRPPGGLMAGLWEFPGGKVEKNESPEDCLLREIREELGVRVSIREKLMVVKHSYTQFRVTLHVFVCRLPSGRIQTTSCDQWKWVNASELDSYPFPAANVKIIKDLKSRES